MHVCGFIEAMNQLQGRYLIQWHEIINVNPLNLLIMALNSPDLTFYLARGPHVLFISLSLMAFLSLFSSCVQLRVTHDTACDSDNDIIRYTHISLFEFSYTQQVPCNVSPTTFGITACSDWWRDFLIVTRHCDIICTKYRSLTWILRYPSLRNAIFGWTVHDLLFKHFPKGWQLIQQGGI